MWVRVPVPVPEPETVPVRVPVPLPLLLPVGLHGMQPLEQPPQLQLVAARIQMPEAPVVPEVLLPELTAQGPRTQHPGRRTAGRALAGRGPGAARGRRPFRGNRPGQHA